MYKSHSDMQELPPETAIWRYMDFLSFYSLLINQSLYFRRLDKYSDALEGTLPAQTELDMLAYRKSFPYSTEQEAKKWLASSLAKIEEHKSFTLSNSWTIDEHENFALWKIYLGGHVDGVAIKTTAGKLKDCFIHGTNYEVSCGKVNYEALSHNNLNVYTVATNKRPPYAYEKEYRALIINQSIVHFENGSQTKKRIPKFEAGENINIDPCDLIESLYISPFSSDWYKGILQATIDNYLLGFDNNKIIHSSIRDK
jgi:hypothetical protein